MNAGSRGRWRPVATGLLALLFAFPLAMLVSGSFRAPGTPPPRELELIPAQPSLEAFGDAFRLSPLANALGRSAILAAIFVVVAVASSAVAGYALATMRRRRAALGIMLALFVAPVGLTFLTRFLLWDALGLARSDVPLIAPALLGGTPFAVLLYALAFRRLPGELIDASRLDLASEWRTLRTVALPLVRGTTVAVAMLAFLQSWNAFMDPLLHLSARDELTAPLALRFLDALPSLQQPVLMAGALIVTLPPVLAFAFAQRALFAQGGAR
jgi:multiple sugar transport system permease protein